MESTLSFKYGVCVRGKLSYSVNTYVKEKKNYIEEKMNVSISFLFHVCLIQLYTKKVLKDQVKACLGNTFGADTNKHINDILLRPNTIVLALIVNYEHGSFSTSRLFKVLSCVVNTIINKYVCIDYLCTEKKD